MEGYSGNSEETRWPQSHRKKAAGGKKKNGSILPNARQRLSKMEAEIRTRILGLEIRSLLVIFRKTGIG